jgi:hypothetical protein
MISRGQMYRQLYGLGSLNRQKYGFGDFVRKIIPNELAEIGSKAAPIVSLFNPALGAGIGALSEYDKSGSLKDALKTAAFDYVLGQAGQKFGTGEFQGSPFQKGNFKETMTTFNNPFKNIFSDTATPSTEKESLLKKIGKVVSGTKEGIKDTKVSDLMKNDLIRLLLLSPTYSMGKKDAEEKRRLAETDFNKYMAEKEAFAKKLETPSELRGYRVARTPTLTDIVRQPVMGGGIMNTRMGYNSGSEDLEYKGWKRIYLKSNDAAESHPRHSEFIKRFAEETMGQDRSPEVRIKKAIGGDLSEPMSSSELENLRAGPDWYLKRIEALMYEYDMDYDTAAEIAFDSDKYFELMPDGLAKGGRPGYAMGNTAQMAAGITGIPLRQNPAGVNEMDLRDTGGFIPPVGIKEKADDIPAMLSNNEFVFTADAVRGMGNGNVNTGAERMYALMKKLEKGGRV